MIESKIQFGSASWLRFDLDYKSSNEGRCNPKLEKKRNNTAHFIRNLIKRNSILG
jgi:hypothetical protein